MTGLYRKPVLSGPTNISGQALLCFIAGALTPFAFAPFDILFLAILGPALLFYTWITASPRRCFLTGYAFGLGLFGVGVNWLHISINLFGGVNLFGAYVFTYILVAFLALYPAVTGLVAKLLFPALPGRLLLALPLLWILSEWARSWIFTGFPWLNLGYSQADSLLSAVAPITGVYGVSLLTAGLAAALVYFMITNNKNRIVTACITLAVLIGCYFSRNIDWSTTEGKISVALAQAAIPQELKWQPEQKQHTLDLYQALTEPYRDANLIIWPETAIPMFYHQAEPFLQQLENNYIGTGGSLLTGIPFRDSNTGRYYNSILMLGDTPGIYHKRHLVPFGEYLPLDRWIRPVLDALQIPMSNFSAGNAEKPLLLAGSHAIGVSICYEDVFGEEVIDALPEAAVLVNISNDAWFGDSMAPHQHLQMARMRAIETGRYMLRATNTGISAIIDDKGNVIAQSPQFKPHTLAGTVQTFTGLTPYARTGNSAIILFSGIMLLLLIVRQRQAPD